MSLDVTIVGESEDTPVINYTPDPIDEYMVIVNLPEDWEEVHNYIINENEIDGIPNRKVECSNDQPFSLRTSIYMMSVAEVEVLKTHPKVETVELNPDKYPQPQSIDTYRYKKNVAFNKPLLTAGQGSESTGYTNGVRSNWSHLFLTNPTSTPYKGVGITTTDTTNSDVIYSLTGKNVDAVTIDTGVGILHPEFIADDGTYRVHDVILDGPYKVDPAAFSGYTSSVTIDGVNIGTRADEARAREWWSNTSIRSAAFQSLGTVTISASYTRIHAHSKNGTGAVTDSHGTSCASQIGGKSFGLAIEANLWNIRINLGEGGIIGGSTSLNICTIWHNAKKINSGNPDPTILNNSWGGFGSTGNSNGTSYSHVYRGQSLTYTGTGNANNVPANSGSCRNNKYFTVHTGSTSTLAYTGDGQYTTTGSTTNTAAENAIAAGVIVVSAAGNTNQKLSDKNDIDFDNLYGGYAYVNRVGGVQQGFSGDHERNKGAIRVGALDCSVEPYDSSGGLNKQGVAGYSIRKVVYSANGPMIDIWAPAEFTMSAAYASGETLQRTDNSSFYDHWFNGTSSACPNTVSLLCLFLESNRSANQDAVRHWLDTTGSTEIALSDPYPDLYQEGYWSLPYDSNYDLPIKEWDGYNVRGNGNLRGATNRVLTNPYASNTLPTISSKEVIQDGLVANYDANNTSSYSGNTYEIDVTNDGNSAYVFSGTDRNGTVSGNNPTINFRIGDIIIFNLNVSGHPFLIKTTSGTGTGNQLISYIPGNDPGYGGGYGVTGNGSDNGQVKLYTEAWNPSTDLYYNCQHHSGMAGTIGFSANSWKDLTGGTAATFASGNPAMWETTNGGIFVFDGTNDSISRTSFSGVAFGTGDFAMEAWVKVDNLTDNHMIWETRSAAGSTQDGLVFFVYGGNNDEWQVWTAGNSKIAGANNSVVADTWYHTVVTRISGTTTLYVDGVSIGSFSDSYNYSNDDLYIGKNVTSASWLNGRIGEVRVYKGSGLTAGEVKYNYDLTKGRYTYLSDLAVQSTSGNLQVTAGDAIKGLQFHTHPEDVIVGQPAETYQKSYGAVVRYVNSSSQYRTSFIVSNNEFSSATVYDNKTDTSSSYMGGFSASRTHMYYKGYWGDRQMIRLSDLTFTGQYKYNSQSPYTYNNSYPNNLMGAQWSGSMYYATNNASEPMGDFTQSTLKTTAGISTSSNGYIHGTASMNGITLWASATSSNSTGINKSRIFKSTDGGVNFTEVYSISPYSFGGYLGAYPHYNGGKFMWWVGADSTNKVFSSSDGETWTDEGVQSSGPGAPTYHGLQEFVYNKYTCKFYRCWNSQQVMSSSDGVTWSQETSFTPAHYNVVVMYDGSMLGMIIDGTNAKFYKYPRSGHKIDWSNPTLLNTSSISSDISSVDSYTKGLYGFTAHSSGG